MQDKIEGHRTNADHEPIFVVRQADNIWSVGFTDPYLTRRYEGNTPQACMGAFTDPQSDELTEQAFSRFVDTIKQLSPRGETDIDNASAIRASLATAALAAAIAGRGQHMFAS